MHILYNLKVRTLDPDQPTADAIVIRDGRILAVGDGNRLRDRFTPVPGEALTLEDCRGRTALPGLTDAHIHLENYALSLQRVNCETATKAECLERVAQRAAETPPGEWILGLGWNQNLWPEGFGNAADLDAVAPDHPVYLLAKSLHAGWANSAALRAANLNENSPDPQGGRLSRDAAGRPDGILFESAMELIDKAIPDATVDQVIEAIRNAQTVLWRLGLTGAHDFDRRRCFAALQRLHAEGELKLRVVKSIPREDLPHAAAVGLRTGFGDDMLCIGGVKIFADGALGPQTAAMLRPYEGSTENRGMLMVDQEELYEIGRQAAGSGLSLTVHAIGDLANHEVLGGYQQLREWEAREGLPHLRHRIEHVQVLHSGDAARLAKLGVIASMQPVHATSDMAMADRYWGERASLSYAWRTQIQHGAHLAFGSDAPVESPNPFWGLHAAVTRQRSDGSPGPQGWYPEQRLTLMEALQAYTSGPAYAAGMEDRLGMLAPGYLADLILLEADPFELDPGSLRELQSQATMVAGEWVYRSF